MEFIIKTVEAYDQLALDLLTFLKGRKKIILEGEIGAGKTTFTKAFCQLLKVEDHVTSPTFSIINEYVFPKNGTENKFYHMDLYRLEDIYEALDIGIEDYLYDNSYCFIEWPKLIEPILPTDVVKINFKLLDDGSRKIEFKQIEA